MSDLKSETLTDSSVVEKKKSKLKRPLCYKVVLLNDDFTPMDFVLTILNNYFSMNSAKAKRVTWKIHTEGRVVCGVYTYDIAETKVAQINEYSRNNQYPLLCIMEEK